MKSVLMTDEVDGKFSCCFLFFFSFPCSVLSTKVCLFLFFFLGHCYLFFDVRLLLVSLVTFFSLVMAILVIGLYSCANYKNNFIDNNKNVDINFCAYDSFLNNLHQVTLKITFIRYTQNNLHQVHSK